MHLIDYVRMPQPLVVLGGMYIVYAAFYIVSYIKDGYWSGLSAGIIHIIVNRIRYVIGLVIITIFIIAFLDKPLSDLCRKFYNVDVYTCLDFINHMGEGWFFSGAIFTIAMILDFLKRRDDAIIFRIAFMTSIFAGLVNGVFKFIFNRERPVIGDNPWHFFHFFVTGAKDPSTLMYAYNSMPSGHTITVVSAFTILYMYSKSKIAKYILIFLSFLIAYARVYTLNHWPSDVCVSAIMGILIGYVSFDINKKRFL